MSPAHASADLPTAMPWSRSMRIVAGLIIATGLILGWIGRSVELSMAGDDATYWAMSWSLQAGHYGELFFVGAPPHAQYPPGFPAWLLMVRALFGNSLDAIFATNLSLLALTSFLIIDSFRRLALPSIGLVAAAVGIWNAGLLKLSTEVMSESLFVALCVLALWGSLRATQRDGTRYATLAVAAALCAFLTRTAGITLLPAILIGFFWRRQWRATIAAALCFGVTTLGWFAYTGWATQRTMGHTYGVDFSAAQENGFMEVLARMVGSTKLYLLGIPDQFSLPSIPGTGIDNLLLGALIVGPAMVGAASLVRRWPALPIFLVSSLGILIIFPFTVTRFMTALVPQIICVTLLGVLSFARAAGARTPQLFALAFGGVLAVFAFVGSASAVQRSVSCRTHMPYADARCYDQEARNYYTAIQFVKDSLPPAAVIAASKPSTVYMLTGHRTVPLILLGDRQLAQVLAPAGPATHILLSRMTGPEASRVAPRLQAVCADLGLVRQFAPATLILRPMVAGDPSGAACQALARYRETPAPTFDLAKE